MQGYYGTSEVNNGTLGTIKSMVNGAYIYLHDNPGMIFLIIILLTIFAIIVRAIIRYVNDRKLYRPDKSPHFV